ncbi:CLEC-51 protein [Aphelenchoides avenae]|nr:CLEC-51 protein [Aphelenchus avenae]
MDGTFCLSVDVQTGQWYSESCGDAKPSLCRVPALATRSSTTTPLPPPAGKCPEGWVHIEQTNKCYQIPIDATSWNEGLAECKSLGGTLASIPSAAANAALFELANNTAADGPLHIGLYRGNGTWRWTDGTPVTYTNWLPNYPLSGTGNCANFHDTYWTTNQDKWYPVYCDYGNYYPLCQCDPIV